MILHYAKSLGTSLISFKMRSYSRVVEVSTPRRISSVDITKEVEKVLRESGVKDGILLVFVPHTTCGVIINENWDPTVQEDIHTLLSEVAPHSGRYAHTEGNADAHIKTAIVGNSVTIPVEGGKIPWGTWQGIFLAEFDGPRRRKVIVKVMGE